MPSFSAFAYINTRLSILAGWLREPELFSRLVREEDSDLAGLLARAGIPASFSAQADQPSAFEHALHELFIQEAVVLLRGVQGSKRSFFIQWLRRHEITNLKVLLRAKVQSTNGLNIDEILVDLGALSAIPVQSLEASEEINEFLRILENTHYQSLAVQARRSFEETQSLFFLEAIVDRYHYMNLVKQYRQLPYAEQKQVFVLLGLLLDKINLVWLLRYRFNNDMDPSQTYYLLPGAGRYLTKERLLQLVQLDDFSAVLHNLPDPWHERLEACEDIDKVDQSMARYLSEEAMSILKQPAFSLARLFAYFLLREQQLKHVAIAISGRYLQLNEDLISRAAGVDAQ